jgi:hypothetical protein
MTETIPLDKDHARLFIALQYLNASDLIFAGLKRQHKDNMLHFVISLRSFIEYSRRGIWFLCWANRDKLKEARNLTFEKPGSPPLVKMDEMINEALGKGMVSPLTAIMAGINEPFINGLHALTHGNPISVRMLSFGLEKIFNTEMLLMRAQTDLGLFRILLYRKMLGEKQKDIWKILTAIHNRPADVQANERIVAFQLKQSGKADQIFNPKKPTN